MIRGSAVIAIAAIVLSLLMHFIGLGVTAPSLPERPAEESTTDAVALGNAFEDLAEAPSEPVPPEPAAAPEPPVETPPEPERAVSPTSEALVASVNPQQVISPGTGSVEDAAPDQTETPAPDEAATDEPSGGDDEAIADPPVTPDTAAQPPKGSPDASTEPVASDAARPPITPAPQQLAAAPAPTVAPVPEPLAVPVIPLERETVEPEIPVTTAEPVPDDPQSAEAEDETGDSGLAVTASLRPRVADSEPSQEPEGVLGGSNDFSALRNPTQLVESPLTVYRRDGIDIFAQSDGGARSGGRGPGNSNTTNYAGQVLVHLNRAPLVRVSARGFARVFFEINPDGTLAWVDITDSSGSSEIDRAAKAQVQSAAPFPRPPGGSSRKLSFVYQIN